MAARAWGVAGASPSWPSTTLNKTGSAKSYFSISRAMVQVWPISNVSTSGVFFCFSISRIQYSTSSMGLQYTAFPRLVEPTFREQASTSSEYRGAQRSRMFRSDTPPVDTSMMMSESRRIMASVSSNRDISGVSRPSLSLT